MAARSGCCAAAAAAWRSYALHPPGQPERGGRPMTTAVREHSQAEHPVLRRRLDGLDWRRLEGELDELGYATTGPLLTPEECAAVAAMYGEDGRFRRRIDMHRHA